MQVLITPLEELAPAANSSEQMERRVAALKKLVELNAFSNIPDPRAWQREARADRELPGREP